jgi:hypothetical protein
MGAKERDMRRVFNDFNDIERQGAESVTLGNEEHPPIVLDDHGEHVDGPPLSEGEKVILTYPGNLEVEACIAIEEHHGQRWWVGVITGAYRDLNP